ncbi:F-box/LRR-repeat protein At4g14103-like [Coffea eugenioides]|uniref:F-box/LRR-repeat protein At4g14103-like n=1 Tax=Coffea eugenioides TaxID=49369 RepID=UPI000F60696A|nr:F-box/LRR-repeat protein At4g14103-like [Coffea eugenioides]
MGAGASSAAAAAAPAAAAAAIYYSEDIRYSFNTLKPLNLFSKNSKQAVETTPDDDDDNNSDGDDGQVNRISAIPDELLSHILSFLPTRESAVTSLLSTRWRYLFASRPEIDLEFHPERNHSDPEIDLEFHPEPERSHSDADIDLGFHPERNRNQADKLFSEFVNFGNRLILLRNRAPLRKFKLSLMRVVESYRGALDSLISAALLCQLQELEISVDNRSSYRERLSPEGIFTCKTLTSLRLVWRGVDFKVPSPVCLPNLKLLCLIGPMFQLGDHDDSLQRLIQGCPLLQELELHCALGDLDQIFAEDACMQIEIRDISSPFLKKVVLDLDGGLDTKVVVESDNLESLEYHFVGAEYKMSINAPNLKNLGCGGDINGVNFIQDLNSLVSAKIGSLLEIPNYEIFYNLVDQVKSVESLTLIQPKVLTVDISNYVVPTFSNLISLEFILLNYHAVESWKLMPILIKSTPHLEKLVFGRKMFRAERVEKEFELLFPEFMPKYAIEHLKEIEFTKFDEKRYEFKLVEYLLQNGKALKKMVLLGSLQPSSYDRIMSYMRCSEDCQIVVEERGSEEIWWMLTVDL